MPFYINNPTAKKGSEKMRKIAKTILATAIIVSAFVVTGCESTTHSSEQQMKKYGRVAEVNRKMLADDFDKFFMLERNSRLGMWHTIVIE
ncbi:MAG: hypothetical protein JXM68_04770 [Sedimentisphaerales bacterium]|nr:hypothetical protein [Sedimentisphaerales bacterium]